MHTNIEQRACDLAVYIIENRATVRSAARQFGISKSTVHKDLTERLEKVNPGLYRQVRQLLDNIFHFSGPDMSAGIWNNAV